MRTRWLRGTGRGTPSESALRFRRVAAHITPTTSRSVPPTAKLPASPSIRTRNMIHRVTIPCSLPTRASMHGGRHGGVGPAVLGPNARERGAGGGNASGGGAAGATASAAASTAAVWQVMVSSKHAGDTIAVVRPAAAKILSKERQDQGLSEAAKAKGNKNKRKRAAQDDAVAGQRMQFVERMNRLAIPLPVMYPPGLYADDPYLDNLGAGNYLYNDEDYDSFDDEDLDEDEVDLY
eukprot:jgi/Botrbrau1/14319/Bobra.0287s0012.1